MRKQNPSKGIDEALSLSSAALGAAFWEAHRALTEAGVPHAVVGGLAVGAHGFPRPTRDLDFLVGDEAFVTHGAIVTFAPNVPYAIGKIAVDYLSPMDDIERQVIDDARAALKTGAVVVVPAYVVVAMKLRSGRARDRLDVIELIKAGIDVRETKAHLADVAPQHLAPFDRMVVEALAEE